MAHQMSEDLKILLDRFRRREENEVPRPLDEFGAARRAQIFAKPGIHIDTFLPTVASDAGYFRMLSDGTYFEENSTIDIQDRTRIVRGVVAGTYTAHPLHKITLDVISVDTTNYKGKWIDLLSNTSPDLNELIEALSRENHTNNAIFRTVSEINATGDLTIYSLIDHKQAQITLHKNPITIRGVNVPWEVLSSLTEPRWNLVNYLNQPLEFHLESEDTQGLCMKAHSYAVR